MEYLRIIGSKKYQRGAWMGPPPTRARQAPLARPSGWWAAQPTSGALLLVYHRLLPGKNQERTFGMKRRRLEAELGQEHFCPPVERFRRGNFPPGGGNHRHHHHQQLSHLGGVIFINLFNSTISSQTLVHLLCSILVPELRIGTCG